MAEIKSTLDLVMERTRHLTLSQEEKQEQKHLEFRKHLKGLIQKFQDNTLKMAQLERQLDALEQEHGVTEKKLFSDEVLERIDPDQDNQPLLQLLNEICGTDTDGLATVLSEYQESLRFMTLKRYEEARARLAENYSISGTAVIPNLATDQEWLAQVGSIRNHYQRMIAKEKNKLTCG